MDESQILTCVREFVCGFKDIEDVQFPTVPYPLNSDKGILYLLLVASINQGTSAEHVRDLVRALYDLLGDDLLSIHNIPLEKYQDILSRYKSGGWKIGSELPKILSSASRFVELAEKHGGMVARGRSQKDCRTAAEKISAGIYFMGKNPQGARKKTWMFMRWMVRPAPDIGI